MLEQVFLKVMDMSLAASMVIVIVFIIRFFLKRFPKYISYMLWSVVLFRLLCPAALESEVSLIPNLKPFVYEYMWGEEGDKSPGDKSPGDKYAGHILSDNWLSGDLLPEALLPGISAVPYTGGEANGAENGQMHSGSSVNGSSAASEASWQELFILYGKYVWIWGIGIMFLYFVISIVRIRNKVSVSIPLKDNIYITDERVSPFVMGILSPRIYLPGGLSEKEQEYIILHEKLHIRRLDHVVKPAAFAALCVHWFNPLVWIAFIFFCKDMEMSCDEAVIKRMGEGIRADYSASLLALSQRRAVRGIPVDFGEGDAMGRVKNLAALRKTRKGVAAALSAGTVFLIVCLAFSRKPLVSDANQPEANESGMPGAGTSGAGTSGTGTPGTETAEADKMESEQPDPLVISLDIAEHYVTSKGDPSNLYYIDENNILWGSGRNEYGQLGQGTKDHEFYSEAVKIAENVVHVDYSQRGFVIYLTKDQKLYGMGNARCGAFQRYEQVSWTQFTTGEDSAVTTPLLLMEDVAIACCGRDDIVCLKEDGTVWTWGVIYAEGNIISHNLDYVHKPKKILENAVLVTGGWFNHAALLQDGTVWTWGYNSAGNCGVAGLAVVSEPTMAAEGVVMVWTDLAVDSYPQPDPDADQVAMAWTGSLRYDTNYKNIAELGDIYPRALNNTVIRKADGSYWVCGENVGTEEKVVRGEVGDYTRICTHEFYPCYQLLDAGAEK